jgi:hypothetical protein
MVIVLAATDKTGATARRCECEPPLSERRFVFSFSN